MRVYYEKKREDLEGWSSDAVGGATGFLTSGLSSDLSTERDTVSAAPWPASAAAAAIDMLVNELRLPARARPRYIANNKKLRRENPNIYSWRAQFVCADSTRL